MKLFLTFFAILSITSTAAFADGQDGQAGAAGNGGASGSNGHIGVNFVPGWATSSYPLYIPILSCDLNGITSELASGANVNSAIYSHGFKATPLSIAIQQHCSEPLEAMVNNNDLKNQPNFDAAMFNTDGSPYDFFQDLLDGASTRKPNVAMNPDNLKHLQIILPKFTDLERLKQVNSTLVKALVASDNGYATYPPNVTTAALFFNRITELSSQQ